MIVTEQQIEQEILDSIAQNRVMLFMKGTPEMPRCGFSAQTVACLRDAGAEFAAIVASDSQRWGEVIRAANIKLD
mgnify:CR=1 FL=1